MIKCLIAKIKEINRTVVQWTLHFVILNIFFSETNVFTANINRNIFVENFMTNIFAVVQKCIKCVISEIKEIDQSAQLWALLAMISNVFFSESSDFTTYIILNVLVENSMTNSILLIQNCV